MCGFWVMSAPKIWQRHAHIGHEMIGLRLPVFIAFLSGMAALVYEITWMRIFTPVFGLSIYATTAVLCAFMGGLGLGSAVAPRVIRRYGHSIWLLYAALEVGIGVGSLLIPLTAGPITSAYVATAGIDSAGFATGFVRFGLAFAVMLIPTIFMGLTLPVLVHAFRTLAPEDPVSSQRLGTLYGINTVGAATGCILVGFVLLYRLGVWHTIACTAALNFALAATVALVYGRRRDAAVETAREPDTVAERENPYAPGLVLCLYGVIGFTSFGYELSWFRLLVFYLQSATESFSTMLTVFLLGLGLGSLFFSRFVEPRAQRASASTMGALLAALQATLALMGVAAVPLYTYIQDIWGLLIRFSGAESWIIITLQKFFVAGLLIGPPTFLMGVAFPLVAHLYKARRRNDSTTMGFLYASNTAGSILGSLATGFVLFEQIGVQYTLVFLAVMNLAIGAVLVAPVVRAGGRLLWPYAGLAAMVAIVAFSISPRALIDRFSKYSGNIIFYSESASDITYVVERDDGHRQLHFNDGRGTSATLQEPNYVNRLLAYSSMAMNPDAKNVLVISMGCGNTAAAFSKFDIERLDVVDISGGAFEAAEYFFTNDKVLEDPRVHTYVEDGRNFLLKSQRQYDVIEIELPSIHADGVVTLYTREFYEIAMSKLTPGGVLSQWIDASQTRRKLSYTLINTMRQVFPGSVVWTAKWAWWVNGVKGETNPGVEYRSAHALFERPRVAADAASVETDFEDVMSRVVASSSMLADAVGNSDVATDDRTIVDFAIPRLRSTNALGGGIAHMGSPMRRVFMRHWRREGVELKENPMLAFYADHHDARVDESLGIVARDFPEETIARIRARNARVD